LVRVLDSVFRLRRKPLAYLAASEVPRRFTSAHEWLVLVTHALSIARISCSHIGTWSRTQSSAAMTMFGACIAKSCQLQFDQCRIGANTILGNSNPLQRSATKGIVRPEFFICTVRNFARLPLEIAERTERFFDRHRPARRDHFGVIVEGVLRRKETERNLEARVGIEPTYKGFADLSLTTWVPRLAKMERLSASAF
jgi:hypothetical protein